MNRRVLTALFVAVLLVSGLLMRGVMTPGHNWGDDFAGYILQARSLLDGAPDTFAEEHGFIVNRSSHAMGPTTYPWGYPLLLAPVYAAFGLLPWVLKSIGAVSYLLFLLVLWCSFRGDHPPPWRLSLLCLFAFNPAVLAFCDHIMSDLPFLLVSTACVTMMRGSVVDGRPIFSRATDAVLLGVCMAVAMQIRSNGVLLILTLGLSQGVGQVSRMALSPGTKDGRRVWRFRLSSFRPKRVSYGALVIALLPYTVFCVLSALVSGMLPDGGVSHASHLKSVSLGGLLDRFAYYFGLLADFFHGAPYPHVIFGASIPLAIVGGMQRYRRDYPAIIYMALTFALYVIWPSKQDLRFLFPLLPFYVSFACTGLAAFAAAAVGPERRLREVIALASVGLLLLAFLRTDLGMVRVNAERQGVIEGGPFAERSQEMFSYVREHTAPDDVIVFFKPRVMKLMADRPSLMIYRGEDLHRGDYLVRYRRSDSYWQMSLPDMKEMQASHTARLVYENEDFGVYRLLK